MSLSSTYWDRQTTALMVAMVRQHDPVQIGGRGVASRTWKGNGDRFLKIITKTYPVHALLLARSAYKKILKHFHPLLLRCAGLLS